MTNIEPQAEHRWLQRLVGDWTCEGEAQMEPGTMMANLWVYDGTLDAAGEVLTLDTDGPNFSSPGTSAKYKD